MYDQEFKTECTYQCYAGGGGEGGGGGAWGGDLIVRPGVGYLTDPCSPRGGNI